jgi:hypothetical protein
MIYSFLYFLSYLFLLPFFLRIIFRYHRIPLGHPLSFLIMQITNSAIYPISKVIPPSLYLDKASAIFTFIVIAFLTQLKFSGNPAGLFFEVLLVISSLDWMNRIIILYIAFGSLRILSSFFSIPRALDIIVEDLTDPFLSKMIFFSKIFPSPIYHIVRKYPLFLWVTILLLTHLFFEAMILERLMR